MNLYSQKQYTKLVLFVLAGLIVAVSLWYSSKIVNKIRDEERQKVRLWSEAIQKRAKLVNYTRQLFEQLRHEERKKVNHWFEATKIMADPNMVYEDYNFIVRILEDNTTIPILIVDAEGDLVQQKNLEPGREKDTAYLKKELELMKKSYPPLVLNYYGNEKQYLYYRDSKIFRELQQTMNDLINSFISETVISSASVPVIYTDITRKNVVAFGHVNQETIRDSTLLRKAIEKMAAENDPIHVKLGKDQEYLIFYEDSFLLTQLRYYPYVMLIAIGIFLIVSYFLFSTFRDAEQNQVWVGLAKETAHQLGTPLSSLIAWTDMLRIKGVDEKTIDELTKDLNRLQTITDRFSKIGSKPELNDESLPACITEIVDYLRPRVSRKVTFSFRNESGPKAEHVKLNRPLFEWVIENICKNAVDAMNGNGTIDIILREKGEYLSIDICDTGKGIPKAHFKTIFEPGFTTKKRGWGLGLSLCKRIVENYHHGKIFVRSSELNRGTTFRILIKGA